MVMLAEGTFQASAAAATKQGHSRHDLALSAIAQRSLEDMGVKVFLDSRVREIDAEGGLINDQRIFSQTVLWAAGVATSPAAKWLSVEADSAGRVKVNVDLSVPELANVFVIGDAAAANCWEGKLVPGLRLHPDAWGGCLVVVG